MTVIILITTIVVLSISLVLFRIAAGSISVLKLNTVSYVLYVQLIITVLVGSVLVALKKIDYHPYVMYISDDTKIEAWLWFLYSLITMPIAMIILNILFKVKAKKDFHSYIKKPLIDINIPDAFHSIIVFGMSVFSILIIFYIIYYTDRIPLVTLLIEGDAQQAAIDRVNARVAFQGVDHVKNLLGFMLIPVFTYYVYIYMVKNFKFYYLISFIVLFLCSTFLFTYDTQKSSFAFFLLGFLILQTFLFKGIKIKHIALFVIFCIGIIIAGYVLTTDVNPIDQLTRIDSAFYGRIFISGYMGYPLSLELFPDIIDQSTTHIGLPAGLLNYMGLENKESARLIMEYVNPEGAKAGTANLFCGYYMGEAWANYGYVGLLIAPFIVGAIVQSVHIYLLKSPKSPLILSFYALITVKWLLVAGFSTFIYLKIIMYPIIFYILVKYILNIVYKLGTKKL